MKRQIIIAIGLVSFTLAGCGLSPGVSPIATPAPTDIASEITAVGAVTTDPVSYLNAGVAVANTSCNGYFNSLVQQSNTAGLVSQQANLGGALASGLLAATGVGGLAATVPGILGPIFTQGTQNYANSQTGGVNPAIAAQLVQKAQNAYLASTTPPTSAIEAMVDVTAYAALCQPAAIVAFGMQAALNAQPTASTAAIPAALRLGAAPGPTPAPPPPHIHTPPYVHF